MAANFVFLGFFCLALIGRGGVSGRGFIAFGDQRHFSMQATQSAGARTVIKAAQAEIGVREVSENSSERIDLYCAYVGLKKVAWCAAFVSFCFGQAGYPQPKTAWSPALFPERRLARDALSGYVFGIYFPELKRIGHCGIIEKVRGEWCETIEGNTGPEGSREGIGVFRRLRHKRTICKYANWL